MSINKRRKMLLSWVFDFRVIIEIANVKFDFFAILHITKLTIKLFFIIKNAHNMICEKKKTFTFWKNKY